MKFRIFTTFLVFAMLLTASYTVLNVLLIGNDFGLTMNAAAAPPFSGGDGSPNDPYQIQNVSQLQNMSADMSAHYILISDIDASNTSIWNWSVDHYEGFMPIGTDTNQFSGSLDGAGYKISDLYINRSGMDYVGLFGFTNPACLIINLTLENVNITGRMTGGLVAWSQGDITNCTATGIVYGYDMGIGLMIGYNYGDMTGCSSSGTTIGYEDFVGGLAGGSIGTMSNCYSTGTVKGFGGYDYIGGFIGENEGTITNCYTSANVNGSDDYVGGFVGGSVTGSTSISNCYSTGSTIGDRYIGGFVGYINGGSITNSYSTGTTSGTFGVGGLIGWKTGSTVTGCQAYGDTTGGGSLGGLIGYNSGGGVTDSFAYGNVDCTLGGNVGGLIGYLTGGSVTNCEAHGDVTSTNDEVGGLVGDNQGRIITGCIATGNVSGVNSVGGLVGRDTSYGDVITSTASGEVTGGSQVGGLIGTNENSYVTSCSALGNVTGNQRVGGLVGYILREDRAPIIFDSEAFGNVSGFEQLGGLIGWTEQGAPIINCTAWGDVTGTGNQIGGLVGDHDGEIENSYAYGDVSGASNVGGLIGTNRDGILTNGDINHSSAFGNSIGTGDNVGGLVGRKAGISAITNSSSWGDASGASYVGGLIGSSSGLGYINTSLSTGDAQGTGSFIGGFIGNNSGCTITNCYSTGNATGVDQVGGFVGINIGPINNSYCTGKVTGTSNLGGFCGLNNSIINDSFWDNQTSGWTTSNGGFGNNTTQMMTQATFTAVGWNFTGTWVIWENETRPFLRMEYSTTIRNSHQVQLMLMDLTADYTIANDIEMDIADATQMWGTNQSVGSGFVPIGKDTDKLSIGFQGIRFSGSLDGQGYTIKNLTIKRSDEYYVALIGNTNTGKFIKNVILDNVNVSAYDYVGGLIGLKTVATITNCDVTGYVNGTTRVGGLIGVNTGGTVNHCSSNITVNGLGNNNGGLLGYSSSSDISNCSSFSTTLGGDMYTGGLIGYNTGGSITDCQTYGYTYNADFAHGGLIGYNTGGGVVFNCTTNIFTNGTNSMGGIIGYNLASVSYCFSYGITQGYGAGGIIGRAQDGTVSHCEAYGESRGGGGVGGLIGTLIDGTVDNCTAYEDVPGTGIQNGGLIGNLDGGLVIDCVAHGNVTGSREIGGLVGEQDGGTIQRCTAYGYANGTQGMVAGLCGEKRHGVVTQCVAYGDARGSYDVAGLVGYMENSPVLWSRAYGNVIGGTDTGGLLGGILNEGTDVNIKHSHAYGNVSGTIDVGGLIGQTEQEIHVINCSAYGNVTGTTHVGGLIGIHEGMVESSSAYGNVDGGSYVGGLIGNISSGSVSNCTTSSIVNGNNNVGGLIGINHVNVSNCIVSGILNATGDYCGGLVGYNLAKISNCSATCDVYAANSSGSFVGMNDGGMIDQSTSSGNAFCNNYVGGIVGQNYRGNITKSYSTGNINGTGNGVGGFVGYLYNGTISNSYAWGDTEGSTQVGGFVGKNRGIIQNCYSIGAPSGSEKGGFSGNDSGNISSCFWDNQTSGILTSDNATAKNTSDMMWMDTFIGWDFDDIWWLIDQKTYPFFQWVNPGPYPVYNLTDLQNIKNNTDADYYLANDIDASDSITMNGGQGFAPIAPDIDPTPWNGYQGTSFSGSLDGQGYNITNFFIDRQNREYQGLFGSVDTGVVIKNINFININVTGSVYTGCLIAENIGGTVENINLQGKVKGDWVVGGLIGENRDYVANCTIDINLLGVTLGDSIWAGGLIGWNNGGTVKNCHTSGQVITNGYQAGGLIGEAGGSISNCSSSCYVYGKESVGGLIGEGGATVVDCFATGFVNGTEEMTGGFVGRNSGTIRRCYSTGNVKSISTNVGGFAGRSSGTITRCYSTGDVNGTDRTGGFVGYYYNDIYQCFSTGDVIGTSHVGGFCGHYYSTASTIWDCYCTGDVIGDSEVGGFFGYHTQGVSTTCYSVGHVTGNSNVGGFVGYYNSGGITNHFWDNETTNQTDDTGNAGNLSGVESNITKVLKRQSTFLNASWDFSNVWAIQEGKTYPYFIYFYNSLYYSPILLTNSISTATEETPYLVNLTADYAWYPTDNTISWSFTTNGNSWFTIDENGTLSGTPSNYDVGTFWLNVTISDSTGNTSSQNFSLTVFDINDLPMITTIDIPNATEDNLFNFQLTAIDIDLPGDILTWNMTSNASWLGINSITGNLSGTPTNADVGTYWVNFTVDDGKGGNHNKNFTFSVTNVNDDPVITPTLIPNNTAEDVLYFIDFNATDIDPTNDILNWILKTNASNWLTINSSSGNLSGIPENAEVGSYWVNITVEDGKSGSHSLNFTLNVTNINDDPMITTTDPPNSTSEKILFYYNFSAIDIDPTGDSLTWDFTTNASWLKINGSNGNLSGMPTNADVGPYWVNVTVEDGLGGSNSINFTLNVTNINDPPTITTVSLPDATEDTFYNFKMSALDIDPPGDILTWTMTSNALWLELNSTTGNLTGTPTNAEVGNYWVNITVDDGNGGSHTLNFSLDVNNFNDDPVITTLQPLNITAEDSLYYYNFSATDIDPTNDIFNWSLHSNAGAWLTINSTSGNLSGTPGNADVGEYWVNVTVSDGNGGSASINFTLNVTNVNDDPFITTSDITSTNEDELYSVDYDAADIDLPGDTLTWALDTNASWLKMNSSTGNLSGMPENKDVGKYYVNVSVSDGNDGLAWQNFTLTVQNVNDDPEIITKDILTAKEGELYSNDYNATDIDPTGDADNFIWSLDTNATWLSINEVTGVLSGTPTSSDVGMFWVEVTVVDGRTGFDSSKFNLTVIPAEIAENKNPIITTEDIKTAPVDELYSVDYTATDDKTIANLVWTMKTNATWLSFNKATKTLSGTPNENDIGTYWVHITVDDVEGGSAFTNFTVTVPKPPIPPNNKPELSNGKMSPSEGDTDTLFTFTVDYFDSDGDDAKNVTLVIDNQEYEMELVSGTSSHGTWQVKLKLSEGKHNYYFTASDGMVPAEPGDATPIDSSTARATPDVDKTKEKKEADNTTMYLAILVVIIIIIGLLAFAMSRRKKEEPAEEIEEELEEIEEEELEDEELSGEEEPVEEELVEE